MKYTTSVTVVAVASVDDVKEKFTSLEAAQAWIADLQARLQWMEDIGLLALVNGHDLHWGRDGLEYLGREREPGRSTPQSLYLMLRRACTYIGKWMSFPDSKCSPYPIDLTDLIVDCREWHRYEIPAAIMNHAVVSSTWKLRDDGYYYAPSPDMMWPMEFKYWQPVYQVGIQANMVFASNVALMEQ